VNFVTGRIDAGNSMNRVFVLQHVREDSDGSEDIKFIGVFSTQDLAQESIDRHIKLPGFCDHPTGFEISECELDKDEWNTGFFTDYYSDDPT
jgi:hypothetical protein